MQTRQIEIFTHYKRPEPDLEMNNGPNLVETAGYIPAKMRIENILDAGLRLEQYRKEHYDFGIGEEIDESFLDVTRNPNYDLADASADQEAVEARLRRSQEAAEEAKKQEDESYTDDPTDAPTEHLEGPKSPETK